MGNAVKSIAPDAVVGRNLRVQRVGEGFGRQGRVECGIEDGDVGDERQGRPRRRS